MGNLTEIQLNSTSPECSAMASIMFTSILSVISSTALIGNILVAATVMKTPSLLTSANYYIVNMAFSDLLGLLFNWLLYVSEGMLTPTGFISRTLCMYGFDCLQIRNVPQSGVTVSLYSKPCVYRIGQIFKGYNDNECKNRGVFDDVFVWLVPILYLLPYAV